MTDYILRISKDEYEEGVFTNLCYYVGVTRQWGPGSKIFFARKKKGRDSFIGHGVIERIEGASELPKEERDECQRRGWKWKLYFGSSICKYQEPVSIKEILGEDYKPGKYLHGRIIQPEAVEAVLRVARYL
ncbi:hypothetical protein KEJ19_05205 [Candidatus Bathyarchaeota archaeon]|nr:hypothetical protein [Candidatus Bathyarchaeota archaeon]